MIDLTKTPPVIEETDIKLPQTCAGCGTSHRVTLFGFKTNAWSTQRQIIPYCETCVKRITDTLLNFQV